MEYRSTRFAVCPEGGKVEAQRRLYQPCQKQYPKQNKNSKKFKKKIEASQSFGTQM